MKPVGLYLHIPFCVRKCAYCDFPSWSGREKWMAPYCERVIAEIRAKADASYLAETLYIGGGTPSIYPLPLMEKLFCALREAFVFAPGAEISMEVNPGTLKDGMAEALVSLGVNRVSMGMQCAQENLLRRLGRIHTFSDVRDGVKKLRAAGIGNINLDLMVGLPGQTVRDADESLDAALGLGVEHLSCYGLIVEEGTKLEAKVSSGAWTLPDTDTEREMYAHCLEKTKEYGLLQYEVSNFSKPGFACRHNLSVWRRGEYLGFGCSAAGMENNVRTQNPRSLSDYLKGVKPEVTQLSEEDAMFESVMLGLRLREGVREKDFYRMHGKHLQDVYGEKWQRAMKAGLLQYENGALFCTERGLDVMNSILVDLM